MTGQALGTIVGRAGDGRPQTVAVLERNGSFVLTSSRQDHGQAEVPAGAGIDDLLKAARQVYDLGEAEFIPAHGATGAKGTNVS
jgi:hypothetical protein